MSTLKSPLNAGRYKDRDIDCQEALEKPFMDIAGLHSGDVVAAAGGTLSPVFMALAKRAESAGWSLEEAEVAISELAQNLLDEDGSE